MPPDQPGLEVYEYNAPEVDERSQAEIWHSVKPDISTPEQVPREYAQTLGSPRDDVQNTDVTTVHTQNTTPDHDKAEAPPKQEKRICGFSKGHFWILVAIAALIVVIAAVGGGVGGALASRNKSNGAASTTTPTTTSSSTSTATATSTTSAVPSTGLLGIDCPDINNENTTVTESGTTSVFQYHCGYDGLGSSGGTIVSAWTIDSCIDQCVQYNLNGNTETCNGATWNGNLTSSIPANGGNCFLKFGTVTLSYCGVDCPLAATALDIS
ncbi:hypothetical protein BX600DRAFT_515493 [Xylariales sp. PMI_506]|nr:hypothetical protein BX600DRAFT_515493 [Xylariales sp. PMI_506]